MPSPEDLHGAWHLRRFVITFDDGRAPLHPLGSDASGLLIYSPGGWMSAVLSRGDRAPLGVARLERSASAPVDAKARAFDSYLSYAGTWHLDGEHVVHRVTLAQTPELVGQENRRLVRRVDGALTLSYRLTARSGVGRTYALSWSRAHA
jgi:hypothetical protein